jgi:hypothetical protein
VVLTVPVEGGGGALEGDGEVLAGGGGTEEGGGDDPMAISPSYSSFFDGPYISRGARVSAVLAVVDAGGGGTPEPLSVEVVVVAGTPGREAVPVGG